MQQHPPTLVGSGRLVVRRTKRSEGIREVRLVEPFELMRMIGWCGDCWQPLSNKFLASGIEALELVSNLAGNAYSLFHVGPVQLASLATLGKFCQARVDADRAIGLGKLCQARRPEDGVLVA